MGRAWWALTPGLAVAPQEHGLGGVPPEAELPEELGPLLGEADVASLAGLGLADRDLAVGEVTHQQRAHFAVAAPGKQHTVD